MTYAHKGWEVNLLYNYLTLIFTFLSRKWAVISRNELILIRIPSIFLRYSTADEMWKGLE